MRIYWTLIGKDLDKLNLPNDLDINVLTFNTDGIEHCLDIIGQSDLGFDGLNIEEKERDEKRVLGKEMFGASGAFDADCDHIDHMDHGMIHGI